MQDLYTSLQQVFGFTHLRNGQEQTIRQLLAGDSSLAIFPTGSGKSLCYQFTALHLPHLTLVVSPLLALMKDQLEFLASKGIAAASLDSTLSAEQSQQVMADVRALPSYDVPVHLRNAPTQLMKSEGYGVEYRYAHDEPDAYAAGECYLPEPIRERRYYVPVERGLELKIGQKLSHLQALDEASDNKRYPE